MILRRMCDVILFFILFKKIFHPRFRAFLDLKKINLPPLARNGNSLMVRSPLISIEPKDVFCIAVFSDEQ